MANIFLVILFIIFLERVRPNIIGATGIYQSEYDNEISTANKVITSEDYTGSTETDLSTEQPAYTQTEITETTVIVMDTTTRPPVYTQTELTETTANTQANVTETTPIGTEASTLQPEIASTYTFPTSNQPTKSTHRVTTHGSPKVDNTGGTGLSLLGGMGVGIIVTLLSLLLVGLYYKRHSPYSRLLRSSSSPSVNYSTGLKS